MSRYPYLTMIGRGGTRRTLLFGAHSCWLSQERTGSPGRTGDEVAGTRLSPGTKLAGHFRFFSLGARYGSSEWRGTCALGMPLGPKWHDVQIKTVPKWLKLPLRNRGCRAACAKQDGDREPRAGYGQETMPSRMLGPVSPMPRPCGAAADSRLRDNRSPAVPAPLYPKTCERTQTATCPVMTPSGSRARCRSCR